MSRVIPHFSSLLPFGFQYADQAYHYREEFMGGQFEAVVEVDSQGNLSSYVWDCEMEEVYTAHQVTVPVGAFIGQVREAYQAILTRVEKACCLVFPFAHDQSNRLARYIEERWGERLYRPFKKSPETGSFRHPATNKWYAVVTVVQRGRLDGSSGKELVEVVNLKQPSQDVAELLNQPGIYPAYHMSKKTWVSVILDGTVEDRVLFSLLEQSRSLVGGSCYRAVSGPDFWVIPANPKIYPIDKEFSESTIRYWPQKATIQAGDLVAIYVTAPVQAICYVCRVLEANLHNQGESDSATEKRLMKVELLVQLPQTVLPRKRMMELGVSAVRGPRRLTAEIIQLLSTYLPPLSHKK